MNTSQCAVFRELSNSVEYHLLTFVRGVLCSWGALRLLYQWRHYGVRFLVHENTKILFRFYFVLNIVISSIFGMIPMYEFVRLRYDCFLLDFRIILLIRGLGISMLFTLQPLMLVLSFERLYSAIFPAHFERHSSKLLSFSLGFIAILGTIAYSMRELSDEFRLFNESMMVALHTANIPQNRMRYQNLMSKIAMSSSISFITLCFDFYLNYVRKPVTGKSLAISYQLSENRRVVLTLLPIELTQIALGLLGSAALLLFGKFASTPTPVSHQLYVDTVTLVVYTPLILTFFIKHGVERLSKRRVPVDPQIYQIEELRRSWN